MRWFLSVAYLLVALAVGTTALDVARERCGYDLNWFDAVRFGFGWPLTLPATIVDPRMMCSYAPIPETQPE